MTIGPYVVTDPQLCGERGVVETVRRAVDGGIGFVQVRDKHADDVSLLRLLDQITAAIDGRARLLVNDRLHVVRAARAKGLPVDGVHLGQGDVSAVIAREQLGPNAIIGLTANTAAHLAAVEAMPPGTVNHLGVGVIRPTSTKPDHPPALGFDGFAQFAAATSLPCVAIGGITAADIPRLHQVGAAGAAFVSALCGAQDPESVARSMTQAWTDAPRAVRVGS